MDALACHQAGVEETVAVLGTALTKEHTRLLGHYASQVLLIFDSDAAGLRAGAKACEMLLQASLEPRVVRLAGAKDPDQFLRQKGRQALEQELQAAADALSFLCDATLEGERLRKGGGELSLYARAQVLQSLFPLLARHATAMEAQAQLQRLCQHLGLPMQGAYEDFRAFRLQATPRSRDTGSAVAGVCEDALAKSPSVEDAFQRADYELLALLACHPELTPQAKAVLPEPDFGAAECQAAAKLLWAHPGKPLAFLEDDGSPDFARGEALLAELAMSEGERFPRPEEHLHKLLLRRRLFKAQYRQAALLDEIQTCLDQDREQELLKEKQRLDQDIHVWKREFQQS